MSLPRNKTIRGARPETSRVAWAAALACLAACSSSSNATAPRADGGASQDAHPRDDGRSTPVDEAGRPAHEDANVHDGGHAGDAGAAYYDAGLVLGPETNPCPNVANAAGPVTTFPWPSSMNDGNNTLQSQTIAFTWAGAAQGTLVELEGWWGQSGSVLGYPAMGAARFANAHWPNELYSPSLGAGGVFDWNTGAFPCGWRPGLYYLGDPLASSITV